MIDVEEHLPEQTLGARFVFTVLVISYPEPAGYDELQVWTGLSRRSIMVACRDLHEAGHITFEQHSHDGRRQLYCAADPHLYGVSGQAEA